MILTNTELRYKLTHILEPLIHLGIQKTLLAIYQQNPELYDNDNISRDKWFKVLHDWAEEAEEHVAKLLGELGELEREAMYFSIIQNASVVELPSWGNLFYIPTRNSDGLLQCDRSLMDAEVERVIKQEIKQTIQGLIGTTIPEGSIEKLELEHQYRVSINEQLLKWIDFDLPAGLRVPITSQFFLKSEEPFLFTKAFSPFAPDNQSEQIVCSLCLRGKVLKEVTFALKDVIDKIKIKRKEQKEV